MQETQTGDAIHGLVDGAAARVAASDEGISVHELQLAARNHGMPLEALRYDVTPTGLHYLLTHYDIPVVDPARWQLLVEGHVSRPQVLDLDRLRDLGRTTVTVTMECAGNGRARLRPRPVSQPWLDEAVGTAAWTGVPLTAVLDEAGLRAGAVDVQFTGADSGFERGVEQDYARSLRLSDEASRNAILAYEMNGQPLPVQHGFPLRLVVPGWYGMAHVKWLRRIDVLDHEFTGFQQAVAYRLKQDADDAGEPVDRIRPRALMIPPGVPDFMTRTRFVDVGVHRLQGRAWTGSPPVTRVEVSVDAGATWADADLEPEVGPWAWRWWGYEWRADRVGDHELRVRAHDVTGAVQPLEQPWNRQGMANNMTQRVPVVVRPAAHDASA